MSSSHNDKVFEQSYEELKDIQGCWYKSVESIEEAVERSKYCNKMFGVGSRQRMAELLCYEEVAPFIYQSHNERMIEGARKISDAELDKGDEQYHEEVDNELSFPH